MTAVQTALVEKAERALTAARLALDVDPEMATNRAYYACFNVARAALLAVGESPKSHKGVHTRFAFHFVATGRLPAPTGNVLAIAAQERERADYEALAVTDARGAADLVADAERFVAAVRPLVGRPAAGAP